MDFPSFISLPLGRMLKRENISGPVLSTITEKFAMLVLSTLSYPVISTICLPSVSIWKGLLNTLISPPSIIYSILFIPDSVSFALRNIPVLLLMKTVSLSRNFGPENP